MVNKGAQVGIYKLTHRPTGKFYIGATAHLYKRWHSHKSFFEAGRNHGPLQAVYNTTNDMNDWSMKMLKVCTKKTLQKNESIYLKEYGSDPKCLNTHKKANVGRRDKKTNDDGRHHLASSLLGKNANHEIRRPNNLTFISPEGKEYPNIQSVKRFAEEHNLSQALMNTLANGLVESHLGWTRKDNKLPFASDVQQYWSRQRMLENYPEYEIIAPTGEVYKTFVPYYFEQEHNCTIIMEQFKSISGVKNIVKGLDKYGRGYRLSTVGYFEILYEGNIYTNVISIGKWAECVGLKENNIQYLLRRPPSNTFRHTTRTKQFEVKKIIP